MKLRKHSDETKKVESQGKEKEQSIREEQEKEIKELKRYYDEQLETVDIYQEVAQEAKNASELAATRQKEVRINEMGL